MSVDNVKQKRIYNALLGLVWLPKVNLTRIDEYGVIEINHDQQFVPNFRLEWCAKKLHYRVYIKVGYTNRDKEIAGYSICTISNALVASGFVMLYSFLHKHRANNKESAYAN